METTWSCVLDDTGAIWRDFLIWVASLTECAAVDPRSIVVHHAADLHPDVRKVVDRLGLRTQSIARFDAKSPHSNKIRQCATHFEGTRVVLTDVDIAFLSRPPVERVTAPIAGKLVDLPNPPFGVLIDIFRRAGLTEPRPVLSSFVTSTGPLKEFPTAPSNFNGGFYVIDRVVLPELGRRWEHWARWLIGGEVVPSHYAVHVDQIAFCMAATELGVDTHVLDNSWNTPSHIQTPPDPHPPFVVHHHGHLDGLRLRPLKPPRHVDLIETVNAAVGHFLAQLGIDHF